MDLYLNSVSAPYLMSPLIMLFNLHPNAPFSETMSRVHDSTSLTQGQCYSSRSTDLPLNLVSAPYLLNYLNEL